MKAVGISTDGLLRIGHQSEPPALPGEKPMTWKIAEKSFQVRVLENENSVIQCYTPTLIYIHRLKSLCT